MPDPLRIVQLNLAYDGALSRATALLARYHTLTGWSRAVSRAGALVRVVQRFTVDEVIDEKGVSYAFVAEGPAGTPAPWSIFRGLITIVREARPHVVHVNGLMFPGMVTALRTDLPPQTVIVLQDHSGSVPRPAMWPFRSWLRTRWRRAFEAADACTFTAADLAVPWYEVGLPREQRILEIPEASTDLRPVSRTEATHVTGVEASPAILWVGRLDRNKDPLTVLDGMERAFPRIPGAHGRMVYDSGDLERDVRQRIDGSRVLRDRVTMVGAVPHAALNAYYSAADIFVSGSHHEGSGYALIEAMACGVVPCVTNIPAFRTLTGDCGALWVAGDADACAAALLDVAARNRDAERTAVIRRFDEALRWDVVGRRTLREYDALVQQRAHGRSQ